jgi:hypothetical protein
VTVAPHSGRSWQLYEHGLLVFESEGSPSGPPRLLVSRLELCTELECSCRDVRLKAISFEVADHDFVRAGLTSEGLMSKFTSGDAMNAQLDIDLGLVEPDAYEGRVPLSEEWTKHVQAQVDGELLDLLHERWLRAKGVTPTPKSDWLPREPSALVGWDEAHPDDREDLYLDRDTVVAAVDLYCVKPACSCGEVRVLFVPQKRGAPPIGSVRVRLLTGELVESESKPAKAAALGRLWDAFRARHRVAERLERRQQQMVELARMRSPTQTPTPVPRATKVAGRNDPCPCGSGKKYKRCCAT